MNSYFFLFELYVKTS